MQRHCHTTREDTVPDEAPRDFVSSCTSFVLTTRGPVLISFGSWPIPSPVRQFLTCPSAEMMRELGCDDEMLGSCSSRQLLMKRDSTREKSAAFK